MKSKVMAVVSLLGCASILGAQPIVRKPILDVTVGRPVDHVHGASITLVPLQKAGLHLHQSPVIGYVIAGTIEFQPEGSALRTLRAGDAFYEPANTRILRFDNVSSTATANFVAFYLQDKGETELIKMLGE